MRNLFRVLATSITVTGLVAVPASATPISQPTNPVFTLSLFASAQSRAALCETAVGAAAAVAAQGAAARPGCVLPVLDSPPSLPVSEVPPSEVIAPAAPGAPIGAAGSILPLLVGLAAVAATIAYILSRDDGGRFDFIRPGVSPV